MTASSSAPIVRRIVVVHGNPGPDLVRILVASGLEVVACTFRMTVWAPTCPVDSDCAEGGDHHEPA